MIASAFRCTASSHSLGESSRGGQPAFPLGLVVLVFFLASAIAALAVMPNTAKVLTTVSCLDDADLRLGLAAVSHTWIQLNTLSG